MKAFETRWREMRRSGLAPSSTEFTAEEVHDYVLATAEHVMYPGVRPEELLRTFPRAWWWPAMEVILHGERRPGTWRSDRAYVEALAGVEPERFAHDPLALVARGVHLDAFHRAHRATVTPVLLAALEDPTCPHRDEAARLLLMLDSTHELVVARAIAGGRIDGSDWALASAGYAWEDEGLRRLFGDGCYELAFPMGYFGARRVPERHPIPEAGGSEHTLGGRVLARHADGRAVRMHHALTLDPVPRDVGASLERLVLAFDLAALADEGIPHHFAHDARGEPIVGADRLRSDVAAREDAHPAVVPTRVQLVRVEGDDRHRTWGEGPGARCDRVGGLAFFVQDSEYPACARCARPMQHLLSLDSRLPLDGALGNGCSDLAWGSGGVATAFWCDRCRTSAWSWACT